MSHTHIVYWYSSVKPSSLREGEHVKYESLGQITSCWVGQYKQGRYNMEESWQWAQSNPRMRPEQTYSRGAAGNSCSSMYKVYMLQHHNSYREKIRKSCVICINSLFVLNYFIAPYFVHDCLFFCRLKINHDTLKCGESDTSRTPTILRQIPDTTLNQTQATNSIFQAVGNAIIQIIIGQRARSTNESDRGNWRGASGNTCRHPIIKVFGKHLEWVASEL